MVKLTATEAILIDAAVQASLANAPIVVTSGEYIYEVTLGTDAHIHRTSPGTEAQTYRETTQR